MCPNRPPCIIHSFCSFVHSFILGTMTPRLPLKSSDPLERGHILLSIASQEADLGQGLCSQRHWNGLPWVWGDLWRGPPLGWSRPVGSSTWGPTGPFPKKWLGLILRLVGFFEKLERFVGC